MDLSKNSENASSEFSKRQSDDDNSKWSGSLELNYSREISYKEGLSVSSKHSSN